MGKHLVLVGGGHAHLAVLKQLSRFISRGHRVTLVSPSPFHDYSGMGPGLLSGRYRLLEARFNIARLTTIRGGSFIEAAATGIDPEKRTVNLHDGRAVNYDVVSFNTGSEVAMPVPESALGRSVFPVKPIANLFRARQKILEIGSSCRHPLRVLVVGGGPAGCEVTGNLQDLAYHHALNAEITQVAGSALLGDFSRNVRNRTRELLAREELRLFEGLHVDALKAHRASLNDGRTLDFDLAFIATGVRPPDLFDDAGLESGGTGLAVNSFLQSPFHPEIFGGGDCIRFLPRPLDKVGVHAVRQHPILLHNLLAALENRTLQEFKPQKKYLLIFNLGLGRAVATGYGINWSGRTAAWLKSRLDRSFMNKFQESA